MNEPLFVTFKVTEDGEVGHPMDHVLTTIQIGEDERPLDAAMAELDRRLRREIARRVAQR